MTFVFIPSVLMTCSSPNTTTPITAKQYKNANIPKPVIFYQVSEQYSLSSGDICIPIVINEASSNREKLLIVHIFEYGVFNNKFDLCKLNENNIKVIEIDNIDPNAEHKVILLKKKGINNQVEMFNKDNLLYKILRRL